MVLHTKVNISMSKQWSTVNQSQKSHNAPVLYPTMRHFATEMCSFPFQNCALWDVFGYIAGFVRWVYTLRFTVKRYTHTRQIYMYWAHKTFAHKSVHTFVYRVWRCQVLSVISYIFCLKFYFSENNPVRKNEFCPLGMTCFSTLVKSKHLVWKIFLFFWCLVRTHTRS